MADYERVGEPYSIACRFVFALLGHRADSRFLTDVMGLGLRDDGRPEADSETWETPISNVFLAGSLADRRIDIVFRIRPQSEQVVAAIAERLQG